MVTDLHLQDTHYQFSGLTEHVQQIFTMKQAMSRPYEYWDRVHVQATWEFDLTLYRLDRDVYGFLDWIGDMGGFFEGILVVGFMISTWWSFLFDNYMIEHLFISKEVKQNGS